MFEGRLTMGDLRLAKGEGVEAAGENLLSNSDFSTDADGDGIPDQWGANQRNGAWALEEQADGSKAFVLTGEGKTHVNFRQSVSLEAGTVYTLIAEMSAQDLPGGTGYLHVINSGWTWSKTISPLTPSSGRQRYTLTFEAPQSELFQVVLRLDGPSGGTIRYHDIRLVEGGVEEVTFASECITFHEAEYQELRLGRTVCDPLPKMNEARVVRVSPGETRQIFLNVDTAALPPGDYTASLLLRPNDRELPQKSIPLRLQVLPVRLPERSAHGRIRRFQCLRAPFSEDFISRKSSELRPGAAMRRSLWQGLPAAWDLSV